MPSRARWNLAVAAITALGGVGELARRRRVTSTPESRHVRQDPPPLPPLVTQSSPGQIADLQEAYGADMTPDSPAAPGLGAANG